jgi:hypothetical protein
MRKLLGIALLPLVFIVSACAKPPTDKLNAAEKAVAEAREAGAPQYMAEDFTKLENSLTNAKSEVASQDSKMAFLRDYSKAEQTLATIPTDAARVASESAKKKEEAKAAALQAQQGAQAAVKTAQDLIAQAPVGKDRAALEAIKADADGLNKSLSEVQEAVDKGDYQGAQAKAKAIQEKGQSIAGEVQSAIDKINAAKAPKGKPGKKK